MSISLQNFATYITIALTIFAGAMFTVPQPAEAAFDIPAGGVELEGFAWSGYDIDAGPGTSLAGLGWISMNCSNTSSCGTSDYKVVLENSGNLSGYAWSTAVGWISFDPAGPFPSGTGVLNDDAQVTGGSYAGNLNLGGWARVCAAAANPATCSGGTNPSAGGWDGWISLAGTAAGGYGITMTPAGATNGSSDYAWGGPVVAGWIDFSPDNGTPPVTYSGPSVPQVTFNCPASSPAAGDPVVCNYTVDDPTASCQLTNNQGQPTINPAPSNTSVTVNPTVDTVYTLTCTNTSGPSAPIDQTITVTAAPVAPDPVIDIDLPDIVSSGTIVEVGITITSVAGTVCELFGPGLTGTNIVVPAAGIYTDTIPTAPLFNSTTIAVECIVNGTPFQQGGSVEVIGSLQEV